MCGADSDLIGYGPSLIRRPWQFLPIPVRPIFPPPSLHVHTGLLHSYTPAPLQIQTTKHSNERPLPFYPSVQIQSRTPLNIMSKFLIWGGEGWVAGHLKTLLEKQGTPALKASAKMQTSCHSAFLAANDANPQERRSIPPPCVCKTARLSEPCWTRSSQPTFWTLLGQLEGQMSIGVRITRRIPSETTLLVPWTWPIAASREGFTSPSLPRVASTHITIPTQLVDQDSSRPT